MPHILLEYSDNIDFQADSTALFQNIHQLLTKELPTKLSGCRSRCIAHKVFYIGDGSTQNAFVHLTIQFLRGRSDDKKRLIGSEILRLLSECFNKYKSEFDVQFSVEFLDLDQNYFA